MSTEFPVHDNAELEAILSKLHHQLATQQELEGQAHARVEQLLAHIDATLHNPQRAAIDYDHTLGEHLHDALLFFQARHAALDQALRAVINTLNSMGF
jgi:hypothetical protein